MPDIILGMAESQFLLVMAAMTSVVMLLVLWIIIRLETKMKLIEHKLDDIGENASEMVKMGLKHFGGNK
tara:strand:+ start:386 stop:592 length:207 start_codon:yes stop_codon:yes gene_type:complete